MKMNLGEKNTSFSSTIIVLFFAIFIFAKIASAGTLSCIVATSCPSGSIIFRMSKTTNGHAELPSYSNYSNVVCCSGVTGLGNSCAGTYTKVLGLSKTTNAHVEQNTQTNYSNNACLSVPTGGTIEIGYQAGNCAGYDTTIGSIDKVTNSHVGDVSAYNTKICGRVITGYAQAGTYLSDNHDLTTPRAFTVIEWKWSKTNPSCSSCDVRLRIQTSNDGIAWTSWSSYFSNSKGELIPPSYNGYRYIRYEATLDGDGVDSPILEEVRIYYK